MEQVFGQKVTECCPIMEREETNGRTGNRGVDWPADLFRDAKATFHATRTPEIYSRQRTAA